MVVPLFTSSSERSFPGSGVPWAVLLAVLLVLGVELGLRLLPTGKLLGYGEGLGTYYEVLHTIEEYGAAEVSIVGSSRGRESIVMPLLDSALENALGRDIYVANYSCPDAKTSEMVLVTQLMMESPAPPRVVLYIISPRALLGNERSIMREEVFGVFPDEYSRRTATFLASFSERSLWNARNLLQKNWLTFRHRYRVRSLLSSLPRGRHPLSPIQGEETQRQRYVRTRSLQTHPIGDAQIRAYVARLLDENGDYVLGETRLQALNKMARICEENGTQLVLVSAPMSADLARNMPTGVLDRYYSLMEQFAAEHSVPFLTTADLGLSFGREDFREQSHLNRQGAVKMTHAISDQILMPILVPPADGPGN